MLGVYPLSEEAIESTEAITALESSGMNILAFGLVGLGLLIILMSILLGLYGISHEMQLKVIDLQEKTPIVHLDPVVRYQLGIPGPMTEAELGKVKIYLESQALLENLALSPIGDL